MLRVTIAGFLLLLLVLPAGAGSPQERPRKWWLGSQARELGLTVEQSTNIDRVYESSMPRIHSAMDDLQNAQRELNNLIAAEKTTETDVIRKLVQTQAARGEVDRQYTLMLFRFYQQLTPDQRQKVRAMFERREQERREGRRGGAPQRQPVKK